MRLLLSGENILRNGAPIVRFQGEQLDYLKGIREGKFKYEEIMAEVERRMEDLKTVEASSVLPKSTDMKAINQLYLDIVSNWEAQHKTAVWS